MPKPAKGEVLIKVMSAPVNPSDIYKMKGMYDKYIYKFNYPVAPGWEGSGVVVKSGGGVLANRAIGKRVGFVKKVMPDGVNMPWGGSY